MFWSFGVKVTEYFHKTFTNAFLENSFINDPVSWLYTFMGTEEAQVHRPRYFLTSSMSELQCQECMAIHCEGCQTEPSASPQ